MEKPPPLDDARNSHSSDHNKAVLKKIVEILNTDDLSEFVTLTNRSMGKLKAIGKFTAAQSTPPKR
jgi:hypothetical protein